VSEFIDEHEVKRSLSNPHGIKVEEREQSSSRSINQAACQLLALLVAAQLALASLNISSG